MEEIFLTMQNLTSTSIIELLPCWLLLLDGFAYGINRKYSAVCRTQCCTLQIPRAAVKLEASTTVEEEHRARLEQIYEAGLQNLDGVHAPSQSQNLQQLYSVWNQSLAVQLKSAPPRNPKKGDNGGQKDGDFYANVGNAIRTLRLEIPMLFQQDFTCEPIPPASLLLSQILLGCGVQE